MFSEDFQAHVWSILYRVYPSALTIREIKTQLDDPDERRSLGLLLYWWCSLGRVDQISPSKWKCRLVEEIHLRDVERMYNEIEVRQIQSLSSNETELALSKTAGRFDRIISLLESMESRLEECILELEC
jgi:hypothetical protein